MTNPSKLVAIVFFVLVAAVALAPRVASQDFVLIKRASTFDSGGVEVRVMKGRFFKNLKTFGTFEVEQRIPGSRQVHFGDEHRAIRAFVSEMAPGQGRRRPGEHQHYTEAILYIVKGKGYSVISDESGQRYRFDWQEGDIWSPPLNWYHDHFNSDPEHPARFLAVLNEPAITSLMSFEVQRSHNKEERPKAYFRPLPFSPLETQSARIGNTAGFPVSWRGVLVRDLRNIRLEPWQGGGLAARLDLSENRTLEAYVGELKRGGQTKLERRLSESFVYILSGKGYSWIWREGEPKAKYEWEEGDLLCIPLNLWQQHVATENHSRYLQISNRPMMEKLMDPGFVLKDNK